LLQLNVFIFLLRKNKQAPIINVAIYKSELGNIVIDESKTYQWTDCSPVFVYDKKANKSQIIKQQFL
jgi:hypothetical protein